MGDANAGCRGFAVEGTEIAELGTGMWLGLNGGAEERPAVSRGTWIDLQ